MIKTLEGSDREEAVFQQAVLFPKGSDILGNNYLHMILVERSSSGSLILALMAQCWCLHIPKKAKVTRYKGQFSKHDEI